MRELSWIGPATLMALGLRSSDIIENRKQRPMKIQTGHNYYFTVMVIFSETTGGLKG